MNKTDRPADELLTDAAKVLEEAYYLLNDAAEKALEKYLETIASRAFRKVILVHIDPPEDLEMNLYEEGGEHND